MLPFSPEQFRTASVVDRGGDWGTRFDAILDVVQAQGNLCVLNYTPEDERAYFETNQVILELATSLGGQLDESVGVVVVWDGASRGDDDVTAAFQEEACKRGLAVEIFDTLTHL